MKAQLMQKYSNNQVENIIDTILEIQDSAQPFEQLIIVGRRKDQGEDESLILGCGDTVDSSPLEYIGMIESAKYMILNRAYDFTTDSETGELIDE